MVLESDIIVISLEDIEETLHIEIVISILNKIKKSVVLQNLKNYDSHLVMQELGKFDLKINIIPCRLEKYELYYQ